MVLSVIVPVYKVEPFLRKCVDSIINQTYRNLEIILVDDGSPDNCGAICDEYANKDDRVKVIHKENGGLSSARNAGMDIAKGDYIAFVDSDDWLELDMYETLIGLAEKYDADIAEGSYRFYRPWKVENKVLEGNDTGDVRELNNIDTLKELYYGPQMFGGVAIMVWTKIYRASMLHNLRFSEGFIHEDVEFTPKAYYLANKVVKIEKTLYNYNIHLGTSSTSGMGANLLKVTSSIHVRKSLLDYFKNCEETWLSEYSERAYYNALINAYYESWNQRKSIEFYELSKEIFEVLKTNKERILKMCPDWKTRLFYFMPSGYCVCVKSLRTAKQLKYRLYVMITGKN